MGGIRTGDPFGKALDLIFPRRCVVCDQVTDCSGSSICKSCRGKIIYVKAPFCMKCGKPLGQQRSKATGGELEKAGEKELCEDCMRRKHNYLQGAAIYEYGSVADALFRFKYGGRQEYALFFGRDLYERRKRWLSLIRPDALVPVPIHPSRQRMRGYNQAELIAHALSKASGIPMEAGLVARVKKTRPQKDLTGQERQNNLKRAFKILRNDVKLNTIVIIDDIYTTGSTIDAVAEVLLEAGVSRIYFLALAVGRG